MTRPGAILVLALVALAAACRGQSRDAREDAVLAALVDSLRAPVERAVGLTFKTPPHAKGVVSITATNGYGTATLANCFTYLLPASGFNMPMMGI